MKVVFIVKEVICRYLRKSLILLKQIHQINGKNDNEKLSFVIKLRVWAKIWQQCPPGSTGGRDLLTSRGANKARVHYSILISRPFRFHSSAGVHRDQRQRLIKVVWRRKLEKRWIILRIQWRVRPLEHMPYFLRGSTPFPYTGVRPVKLWTKNN